MKKFAFIGFGNMGGAIAAGFIKSGAVAAENICAYAPHTEKLKKNTQALGIASAASARAAVEGADTVIMAVKPYQIEAVLAELKDVLAGKALVSIALGYNFARLCALVPKDTRVQFIMPNTPAMVGEGALLFEAENSLAADERAALIKLFARLGTVVELPASQMGIGGAISGCGPAFCALMIEALADAGVKYGLGRAAAYQLASQTLLGTGKLQLETGMHPGALKDGVCSPGGTTIRGVEALERAGLRAAMMDAIQAIMEK